MTIRNILVHQSQDPRSAARLDLALALAKDHEAQLTALYVIPAPNIPAYFDSFVPDKVFVEQRSHALEAAAAAKARFLERAEHDGLRAEWREVEAALGEQTGLHARFADVVVVGQADPKRDTASVYDLAEELVLMAGRPVIAVPFAGTFDHIGRRVLVAWNGTREASRAVHDALPILVKAKEVVVYSVNPHDADHPAGADIAAHLAHHGVAVEAHQTVSRLPENETALIGRRSVGVGDLLLSAAADFGSDLLVMGAYGHSRVRELVLGGATRYVLQHMTVPVLMSH